MSNLAFVAVAVVGARGDDEEEEDDDDDDSSNVDATAHPDMPDPIIATRILLASEERAHAVLRIMIIASSGSSGNNGPRRWKSTGLIPRDQKYLTKMVLLAFPPPKKVRWEKESRKSVFHHEKSQRLDGSHRPVIICIV
jgi:hypothetical protein